MTSEVIRNNLEIINQYRFDGPHCEDERKDTDIAILNFINRFLRNYGHLLKMKYPIVIEYNPLDGLSYLSYKLIKNISPLTTVKPEFYIYSPGLDIDEDTKRKLFPDATIIGLKKMKKLKHGLYVVGYHPIYNVSILNDVSKQFVRVYPIESFTPPQINQLFNFYMKKDDLGYMQVDTEDKLYKFYQYPIGADEVVDPITPLPSGVTLFKLSGTDEDFGLYDLILKKDIEEEDRSVFLYMVDTKEQAEYTKLNLNPYMHRFHAPNDLNIIIGKENTIFNPQQIYSYKDYVEGDK